VFLGLETEYKKFNNQFSEFFEKYNSVRKKYIPAILWQSMTYSFDSGGKRFRPFLSYLIAETLGVDSKKIMSVALAVEMIHTYSLIHDDLPCMDNDDFRRGQPTNHKKFGEDIALLAGDALQAEAFWCLAHDEFNSANQKISVIQIFSNLIGSAGMVAGQVLDMKSTPQITLQELENIHHKKTAELISFAVLGAALFSNATESQMTFFKIFSKNLGLAFQIKDDLLDGLDGAQDHKSYLKILGLEKTKEKIIQHSKSAEKALAETSLNTVALQKIIKFNLTRDK